MPVREAFGKLAVVLLALSVATMVYAVTFTYVLLPSTGLSLGPPTIRITSFPNPSKNGQSVLITGLATDDLGRRQSGILITIQCSTDQREWNNFSTWTDQIGIYRKELNFSSSGLYYVRAVNAGSLGSLRHVVADFIIATDNSEDFADIQMAIDALPSEGGVVYVRSGIYDLNPKLKYPYKSIALRSNLTLIGAGIDQTIVRVFPTKQPANSNVRVDGVTSMEDVENLLIENLTLIQNGTPDNKGSSALLLRCGNHKDITIRNVKVTDSFGAGIAVPNFKNVLVEHCVIDDVWTGITLVGGSIGLVKDNIVTNTCGDGIFLQTYGREGPNVADVVIEDNYLENIGDTGIDITANGDFGPHERIVARNNTLKKASIRVSNAVDIRVVNNTVKDGRICVDAGQGRPVNIIVAENNVVSSAHVGIGFYGALDAIVSNNVIEMLSPQEGMAQSGIVAAIWGTGLILNNTVLNAANYGISFANWGLGGGSNITMRGNIILDFHDIGIYDDAKRQGGLIIIEDNIIKDTNEPFVSRYGIRTDCEENKWIIRKNQVYGGRIEFISAPFSDVYDNIHEP